MHIIRKKTAAFGGIKNKYVPRYARHIIKNGWCTSGLEENTIVV